MKRGLWSSNEERQIYDYPTQIPGRLMKKVVVEDATPRGVDTNVTVSAVPKLFWVSACMEETALIRVENL